MGTHPQQYIHNIASSIMGQIGGISTVGGASVYSEHTSDANDFPQTLWDMYGQKVMDVLGKMGPSARGRIAACGIGYGSPTDSLPHWHVYCGRGLDDNKSGNELLTLLASYVVAAAIVDIIRAQVQKVREDEWQLQQQLDQAMADYTHYGPNHGRILRV